MKTNMFISTLMFSLFSASLFANSRPAPTDIVKAYYSAFDANNTTAVEKLLADDCLVSIPFAPQPVPKQAFIGIGQGFKAAFSNMQHEILNYYESGSTVSVRGIFKGKNDGPMMGNPATNNDVSVPFNSIFELNKAGKIKAVYVQFDQKVFEAQLMAGLPSPATPDNAAISKQAHNLFNEHKFDEVLNLAADNIQVVNYATGQIFNGKAEFRQFMSGFKTAFPDLVIKHTNVFQSENGYVTLEFEASGTQTGPLAGPGGTIPPTGKSVKLFVCEVHHVVDGKITSIHNYQDSGSLMRQLGLMPAPGEAAPK